MLLGTKSQALRAVVVAGWGVVVALAILALTRLRAGSISSVMLVVALVLASFVFVGQFILLLRARR